VLQQSIDSQGTTFRDYRNGLNQEGGNQSNLQVYGKDKEQCPNCGKLYANKPSAAEAPTSAKNARSSLAVK
jgi:formamidopyrimidine-DNA glycosylase